MCLAVPARIIEMEGDRAVADAMGTKWNIRTTLTPDIGLGDIVLVHAGYAITKVDEEEARKTWELFEEIARLDEARQKSRQEGAE
jgi:hydrogenase expression/formation protein HypC